MPVLELLCYILQLLKELHRGFPVRTLVVLDVLDEQVEGADVDPVYGGHIQPIGKDILRHLEMLPQLHSKSLKLHLSYLHYLSDGIVFEVQVWDKVKEVVQVELLPLPRPTPRRHSLHR